MIDKKEEIKLIKGCLDGKEKCFKALYSNHFAKMLNVCLRYTKNIEEAKDVLHEGFIKVFKQLGSFKGEGSFEGWVRVIMIRTAIDNYHKNQIPSLAEYARDEYHEQKLLESMEHEEKTLTDLSYQDLLGMIQKLSPAYRIVFSLYVIEGYSHKEIAEQLNISEGTSRSNLLKARANLKVQLITESPFKKKKYV